MKVGIWVEGNRELLYDSDTDELVWREPTHDHENEFVKRIPMKDVLRAYIQARRPEVAGSVKRRR